MANPAVNLVVQASQLLAGQRTRAGEVEAQALRLDQRAALFHRGANHITQSLVQKMRGAVVAHGVLAPLADDIALHAVTKAQIALVDFAIMDNQTLDRLARV